MSFNLEESIVLIHSRNEKNKVIGTGFIVHTDTDAAYLLTCSHVVDDVNGSENILADGFRAKMIANDNQNGFDLAVLKVEGLRDRPILKLSALSEEKRLFIGIGYWSEAKVSVTRNFSGVLDQKIIINSIKGEETQKTHGWSLEIDPKNPLKDGNSGSPVIDLLSKSVVGIVTAKKNSGKEGTAVAIETLEKIWSDMPANLIFSDANDISRSEKILGTIEEEKILSLSMPIIATALTLIGISIVSLWGSYYKYSSAAWQKVYPQWYSVIEFCRTVLIILELLFLIRPYFSQEIKEFFGLTRLKKENKKILFLVRFIMIFISTVASSYVLLHNLSVGPEELANHVKCLSKENLISAKQVPPLAEGYQAYYLPYRWYLFYSCVNYIILIFPAISMITYSVVKDLRILIEYRKIFVEKIRILSEVIDSNISDFLGEKFIKIVEKNFNSFRENFIKTIKRYTIVFLVVAFMFSYDFLIGHLTLSVKATIGIIIALGVMFVALIMILLGYLHYEDAYQEANNLISNISLPMNAQDFQRQNNSRSFFLQRLSRQFLSLSIGAFLIIFSLIVFLIVKLVIIKTPC